MYSWDPVWPEGRTDQAGALLLLQPLLESVPGLIGNAHAIIRGAAEAAAAAGVCSHLLRCRSAALLSCDVVLRPLTDS